MAYNYVVTAHKPTGVNACVTGKYTKPCFSTRRFVVHRAPLVKRHVYLSVPAPVEIKGRDAHFSRV